jgi:phage head maturation protease
MQQKLLFFFLLIPGETTVVAQEVMANLRRGTISGEVIAFDPAMFINRNGLK